MKPKILFIHGMFLTGKTWEHWLPKFEELGYECIAPSWPLHEGEPSVLRAKHTANLGELSLDEVVDFYAAQAERLEERPIVIGHSLGGLIAQILVSRGLASSGVCLSSVAPNAMLSADWSFLRNSAQIINPLRGSKPCEMTEAAFHKNFCNVMSQNESDATFRRYAVPESRNVLRDAMGRAGHVDLHQSHEPLLFIAGEKDAIIPDKLNQKNAEAYTDITSVTNFREFTGRGHFICGQRGWEQVADYVADWLAQTVQVHEHQVSYSR